jgi:hypothetical protein
LSEKLTQFELADCKNDEISQNCFTSAVDITQELQGENCNDLVIANNLVNLPDKSMRFAAFLQMKIDSQLEEVNLSKLGNIYTHHTSEHFFWGNLV